MGNKKWVYLQVCDDELSGQINKGCFLWPQRSSTPPTTVRSVSVSYTHLDVYKRQIKYHTEQ